MPRKQKQYHFIYKTVNHVNGKYYIGMHSTDNLEDDYLGSGQRLWHAIRKYGRENFFREYLEFLPDRISLKSREREIVNEILLQDPLCMNLRIGGNGWPGRGVKIGGDNCKAASEWWKNADRSLTIEMTKYLHREAIVEKASQTRLEKTGSKNGWKGRTHTEKFKKLIGEINSRKQQGESNSNFGKMWITNGIENRSVKREETIPEGWRKGRKLK